MLKNLIKKKTENKRKKDAYSVALFTSMTREGNLAFDNNKYDTGLSANVDNAYSAPINTPAAVWPGVTGYPKVSSFQI